MDPKLLEIARSGKVDELNRIKNQNPKTLTASTPKGNTALHIASRLGRTKFAATISDVCPSLLLVQNSRGDTALHVAARAGHSALVAKLIEKAERANVREEMMQKKNRDGNTPLHEGARNRDERVVEQLLMREEGVEMAFVVNKVGASALYLAGEGGCVASVERIVGSVERVMERARAAAFAGPNKRTALHAAVFRGECEIAKKLLQARQELIQQKDKCGNSPLHYAAALGDLEMVRILLRSDTSIAYLKDKDNRSPFHVAASNNHVHIMKELLLSCPDSGEVVDHKGWNGLHVAVERGNLEVVRFILYLNELEELINEPNCEGNTPLHLAIINRHFSILNLFIRDKRVDLNAMNHEGETAVDIAESDQELSRKFHKILVCKALAQAGGRQGLQKRDKVGTVPRLKSYKGMSKVISMVAGLIISVSFNSAFSVPGGYHNEGSDKGKAVLTKKPLLWLFIITDSIALFSSISVALLLFFADIGDSDLLVAAISIALKLMAVALVSLCISFMLGLSLVLSEGLAVLVYLICLGVFFLGCHWFWTKFPLLDLCFKISFPKSLSYFFGLFHSNFNQCLCFSKVGDGLSTRMGSWRTRWVEKARSSGIVSRLLRVSMFRR
ncbi:protein ACCELERATED CELL DEATH 6 [Cinnamomum micranthum f. kanehirae]|uniref:Protein ACCELERATED CELL DEATH 6 n=1 Tax=Cinnamomum micranthum f. kanehirae TaxID=337451 RepID=A0A3S3QID1_9MAGN|nr:protein ACCELERATED CELL DEATH 6 [Cinnamomum micranthum f. kanehirae]